MASGDGPPVRLSPGISGLFNSPLYSDLKVRCKDCTVYNVHKSIVCSQSAFFTNACKPEHGFKESRDGIIDLTEESSAVVGRLLEYFYRHNYTVGSCTFLTRAELCAAADFFQVSGLETLASERFETEVMRKGFWKGRRLRRAIEFAYSTALSSSKRLRECVVKVAGEHLDELKDDKVFVETSWNISEFSLDVAEALQKELKQKKDKETLGMATMEIFSPCSNCRTPLPNGPCDLDDLEYDDKLYCWVCGHGEEVCQWQA